MRAAGKRTYVKMHVIPCLEGSIRYQLEPDERGAWYDLIIFSALCAEAGIIADSDNRPFPNSFIASRLNISEELLERTLEKCKEEGRITEDEQGIRITNWAAYQSEYERQKPYREEKKRKEQTPEQKQDQEYLQETGLKFRSEKKRLGRELTTEEGQAIKDAVGNKIYGARRAR